MKEEKTEAWVTAGPKISVPTENRLLLLYNLNVMMRNPVRRASNSTPGHQLGVKRGLVRFQNQSLGEKYVDTLMGFDRKHSDLKWLLLMYTSEHVSGKKRQ